MRLVASLAPAGLVTLLCCYLVGHRLTGDRLPLLQEDVDLRLIQTLMRTEKGCDELAIGLSEARVVGEQQHHAEESPVVDARVFVRDWRPRLLHARKDRRL